MHCSFMLPTIYYLFYYIFFLLFYFFFFFFSFFFFFFFFFQAEDGIRDGHVTGVQTCALPISDRVSEVMQLVLSKLLPDRVMASSYATGNNLTGWGVDPKSREEFLWYIFESGGCGARASKDGNSAEWHLMANCKNESMEVWEQRYPVRFLGYELVKDSAGPGKWRGGLGVA